MPNGCSWSKRRTPVFGIPGATSHLVATSENLSIGEGMEFIGRAGQIVVCFLPYKASSSPCAPIVESLQEANLKGFKAWCHYGGEIRPDEIAQRWRDWPRLSRAARGSIDNSGNSFPPLPFSHGQRFLWSYDLDRFRGMLIAGVGMEQAKWKASGQWNRMLDLLEKAWAKAQALINTDTRVAVSHRALPAYLAAKHLLDSFPSSSKSPLRDLEDLSALCDGLTSIDLDRIFGGVSTQVRTALEKARERASLVYFPNLPQSAAAEGIEGWRNGLGRFLRVYREESIALSTALAQNPQQV